MDRWLHFQFWTTRSELADKRQATAGYKIAKQHHCPGDDSLCLLCHRTNLNMAWCELSSSASYRTSDMFRASCPESSTRSCTSTRYDTLSLLRHAGPPEAPAAAPRSAHGPDAGRRCHVPGGSAGPSAGAIRHVPTCTDQCRCPPSNQGTSGTEGAPALGGRVILPDGPVELDEHGVDCALCLDNLSAGFRAFPPQRRARPSLTPKCLRIAR